jgi:hypothetical protein
LIWEKSKAVHPEKWVKTEKSKAVHPEKWVKTKTF